ncbi:MAG: hypothetical protein M0T77_14565 [Actinomycetota bacterium]|nr:hypothetical protein [Actinomycetota bacterium]
MARKSLEPGVDVRQILDGLSAEELREVLAWAADWHEDVERRVRLLAARATGDLRALRAEVDRGLRTRRFLGYRESVEWAHAARPVLTELEAAVGSAPSRELVELLERAVSHVVKVIQTRADDSSGLIGDLARDLLDLHARACDSGVADPVKLARWMIRFRFVEQDFFEPDPVRYRKALGEKGLAEYRSLLAAQSDRDGFALRYAHERLAVLGGDSEAIIALLGGDLSRPHQFIKVAEAMAELGRDDEVIEWARRGIAQTSGWQVDQLYDLACEACQRRDEPVEILALRRAQHERTPTSSSYLQLKRAAVAVDAWSLERDGARRALREHNPAGLIDALLADGDDELAWQTATAAAAPDLGDHAWLKLAEARQKTHPTDVLPIYWRTIETVLETADRRAYASAIRLLKRARDAAGEAGQAADFETRVLALREQHRRRPALISMLDKAKLKPT